RDLLRRRRGRGGAARPPSGERREDHRRDPAGLGGAVSQLDPLRRRLRRRGDRRPGLSTRRAARRRLGRVGAVIPWLRGDEPFPPVSKALKSPNGLLCAGGDLSPARLLEAYRNGIFPWFSEGDPILW